MPRKPSKPDQGSMYELVREQPPLDREELEAIDRLRAQLTNECHKRGLKPTVKNFTLLIKEQTEQLIKEGKIARDPSTGGLYTKQ